MPISVPLGVARRLAPCDRPAPRRKPPRQGSRTRSPRPPVGQRVVAPACSEPEWRWRRPLRPHRPRPPFSGNHAGRSPDLSCLPPCLQLDLVVPEVLSCLCQNAPFPVAAARLFGAGTASTPSRKLPMVWQRLRGQGREREEWVSLFPLLRVVILRAIAAEEAAVSEIRRTGGTNASRLTC